MTEEKPLFIPLKGEYFDLFKSGEKTKEYRAYGPRWNEKTCRPGRAVVLSRGYGKAHRLAGVVVASAVEYPTKAFLTIYGEGKECFAIQIDVQRGK